MLGGRKVSILPGRGNKGGRRMKGTKGHTPRHSLSKGTEQVPKPPDVRRIRTSGVEGGRVEGEGKKEKG